METITLSIPNMKSSHCQVTVANTVKSLGGSVKNVEPMKAEIDLKDGLTRSAVIEAIEKAGYNVSNT
jgi:copper chaperone